MIVSHVQNDFRPFVLFPHLVYKLRSIENVDEIEVIPCSERDFVLVAVFEESVGNESLPEVTRKQREHFATIGRLRKTPDRAREYRDLVVHREPLANLMASTRNRPRLQGKRLYFRQHGCDLHFSFSPSKRPVVMTPNPITMPETAQLFGTTAGR
jgi:hypothetical protein